MKNHDSEENIRRRYRTLIDDELRAVDVLHRRAHVLGLGTAISLRENHPIPLAQYEDLAGELSASALRNPSALMFCVGAYDENGHTHAMGTASLMILVASHMRLSENDIIQAGVAGLLHDIGKINVNPKVLDKPGPLTMEEFRVVALHPGLGSDILGARHHGVDADIRDVVRHHHERLDGAGYPDRLAGEEIPRLTRLTAITDAYDALTRDRPYHAALTVTGAVGVLRQTAHGKFDPQLLEDFIACLGPYPAGTLVQLTSRRLGFVVEQREENPAEPLVNVFFDTSTRSPLKPVLEDLALHQEEHVASIERPSLWDIDLPMQMRLFARLH